MFDAVYVINLATSTDRWASMQRLLAHAGFSDAIRFEAIDGHALGEAGVRALQDKGLLARDLSRFDAACRAGEIGCALSHAAVMRELVEKGVGSALVLEDDVALAGDPVTWRTRCERAHRDLPPGWDLWFLYRCFDVAHRVKRLTKRIVVPWTPLGGAAYAVSERGARKILPALQPLASAIDRIYVEDLVRPGRLEAYAASPLLIEAGTEHPSIINFENPEKGFVVSGVNRPPEYWPREYLAHLGEQAPRRWWQRWYR